MKKLSLFFICCAIMGLVNAQAPFMNYQGVARNAAGQPLASQTIAVRSTIISDYPAANTTHYIELRSVTTNQFGLFSFQIGNPAGATVIPLGGVGVPQGTEYFVIPWEKLTNAKLNTAISTNGGSSFTDLGTSALTNVPFANVANYAKTAAPWATSTPNNTITPDLVGWKLGLGTNNATEKLHVVGKIRMVDGQQGSGKVLTSDSNGVASWKPLTDNPNFQWVTTDYPITPIGPTIFLKGKKISLNPGFFEFSGAQAALNKFITIDINDLDTFQVQAAKNIFTSNENIFKVNVTNDPNSYGNYPVQINGSGGTLGMSIRLNGGVPNQRKYISFFEESNIKGRIEGQTVADVQASAEYIRFVSVNTAQLVAIAAEGVACGLQVDVAEVVVMIAQAAIWASDILSQGALMEANAGISYASGSADYAEWLERENLSEKFTFGDVVLVKGGKISKNISPGGQLMVISKSPVILGNMQDEKRAGNYEKVAFMGQVPVKVKGVAAVGDYIVATGNNDGMAYAINPKNVSPEEYHRIVGVAWAATSGNGIFNYVNTAVGLHNNAATDMIQKQENEISLLKNSINRLSAYLQSKDASFQYTKFDTKTSANGASEIPVVSKISNNEQSNIANTYLGKNFSGLSLKDEFNRMKSVSTEKLRKAITEHPEYLDLIVKEMKEGIDAANPKILTDNPNLKRLLTDREFCRTTIKKEYGIL